VKYLIIDCSIHFFIGMRNMMMMMIIITIIIIFIIVIIINCN